MGTKSLIMRPPQVTEANGRVAPLQRFAAGASQGAIQAQIYLNSAVLAKLILVIPLRCAEARTLATMS